MVVILAMGIGLFAPPFGLGYHAACTIGRVSPDAALLRIWPDLGVLVLGLLLIAAVPWISIGSCPSNGTVTSSRLWLFMRRSRRR